MGAVPIYDLTTLLTTIASISASFVAILGGFIASKLISISENRSSTLDKLRSLDKEISVKISLKESLQDENNESDALDFIDANFRLLVMATLTNYIQVFPRLPSKKKPCDLFGT